MAFIVKNADLSSELPRIAIHICKPDRLDDIFDSLSTAQVTYAKARNFAGETGQIVELPNETGQVTDILFGIGADDDHALGPINTGTLSQSLSDGQYVFRTLPDGWSYDLAALGWGLGAYQFSKYLPESRSFPRLDIVDFSNRDEIAELVEAIHWGRDLINTPANDMGPEALEGEARRLASRFDAKVRVTKGEELLVDNYPMIHAVGRAAHQAPRLVELEWGQDKHPRLAVCGKGITFDTGGVNIKSATGARLMKKDMGGAAHALALARMIMANNLPVNLHILLAVAENSVSGASFRPGDVLTSRAGKTIEIDNTDAEGRLVLGDALFKAAESDPALIIDFATLTGAARVALGPTLPPFFTNRPELSEPLLEAGRQQIDPFWPMPLWAPYLKMLKSPIATLKNAGGSFAGCVTAALFLEQFVDGRPWMHFDVYGWNPSSLPGHPIGGEMFTLRAVYHWLKAGGLEKVSA